MAIDEAALDALFRTARTRWKYTDQPVTDDDLRQLFALLELGPTSANCSPARFVFIRTAEGKEKLKPALSSGNLAKTMAAPVNVIVAYDPGCSRRWMQNPGSQATRTSPRKPRSATARCKVLT